MDNATAQVKHERTDTYVCPDWCTNKHLEHEDDSHSGPHRVVRDGSGGWVEMGAGTLDGQGFMVTVDAVKVPMLTPEQAREVAATLTEFADWCEATAAADPASQFPAGSATAEIAWVTGEARALQGSTDHARIDAFLARKRALLTHIEQAGA